MTPTTTLPSAPAGKPGRTPRKQEVSRNPMDKLVTYLKGVRTEWTKISWPSRLQIVQQTVVVLMMTSIMTLGLFLLDYSLHFIISNITPHRS